MKLYKNRRNLRVSKKEEDINPMDGMGNMADAMLVFATGILIALIISWNVSVDEQGAISPEDKATYTVEDISQEEEEITSEDTQMEDLGRVYKDPSTGKLYIMDE